MCRWEIGHAGTPTSACRHTDQRMLLLLPLARRFIADGMVDYTPLLEHAMSHRRHPSKQHKAMHRHQLASSHVQPHQAKGAPAGRGAPATLPGLEHEQHGCSSDGSSRESTSDGSSRESSSQEHAKVGNAAGPPANVLGEDAARAPRLALKECGMLSAPPVVKQRFIFVRGVQLGAHDLDLTAMARALFNIWPAPFAEDLTQVQHVRESDKARHVR